MDKSPLDMDNKIPSDDMGEMWCSDLDVPIFTESGLDELLCVLVRRFTAEHWILLLECQIHSEIRDCLYLILDKILEVYTNKILDVVMPQVTSRMQMDREVASNSSNSLITASGTDIVQMERNYTRVTTKDIEASLGNLFDTCFGVALGVTQKRSHHSETLMELMAAKMAKRVNCALHEVTHSDSSQQSVESAELEDSRECDSADMVFCMANILRECLVSDNELVSAKNQEGRATEFFSGTSPHQSCVTTTVLKQKSCEHPVNQAAEHPVSSAEETSSRDKTFFTVFLGKLLDYIAHSTKTSVLDVDFDGMLEHLRKSTVGSATPPQTVGNIHISIYKELCRQFESPKLLHAAMMSGDEAFQEAIARTLKAQLSNTSGTQVSFGTSVKRIFTQGYRTVAPACEINPVVSQSEVINPQNTCMPPPQRGPSHSAIIRMFSSMTRALRKSFTCRVTAAPQDD